MGEHVVHVARDPGALAERDRLRVRLARLAQLVDELLRPVAPFAQLAHQPDDQKPRNRQQDEREDLRARIVGDEGVGDRRAADGEHGDQDRGGTRSSRIALIAIA